MPRRGSKPGDWQMSNVRKRGRKGGERWKNRDWQSTGKLLLNRLCRMHREGETVDEHT